jgi:general secretion pathway protein H
LLELLVVMLILSFVMALTVVYISRGGIGDDLKTATRKVAATARQARAAAVLQSREVVFEIDVGQRLLGTKNVARKLSLPESIQIKVEAAKSEQIDPRRAGIRFFPNGGSTGGRVTLSAGSRHFSIVIDWLNGRIFIEDQDGATRNWTKIRNR